MAKAPSDCGLGEKLPPQQYDMLHMKFQIISKLLGNTKVFERVFFKCQIRKNTSGKIHLHYSKFRWLFRIRVRNVIRPFKLPPNTDRDNLNSG